MQLTSFSNIPSEYPYIDMLIKEQWADLIFVSETLKTAIEAANLTGIAFSPVDVVFE